MAINSKHPAYTKYLVQWIKLEDTYEGEQAVKDKGETYLPPTPGQRERGMENDKAEGRKDYNAYLARAVFPSFVSESVEGLVGIMHHKPPVIELPAAMEPLRQSATTKGEPLDLLLRNINEAQLVTGRYGLLVDVPDGAPVGTLPYIASYRAKDILNWDDGQRDENVKQNLNLVVLEESEYERQEDFDWKFENKYRVLVLGDVEENEDPNQNARYRVGVFRDSDTTFNEDSLIEPTLAGRPLEEIPFVFINSGDLVPEPDKPPLQGLADLALTVYRGEADYRQALFNQGQDTLVVIGGTEDSYTIGAGAHINITPGQGNDAKFIGVDSQGLPEMRSAIENDRTEAADLGGRLIDNRGGEEASGNALSIRVSARTASVKQIAMTGAAALEKILKIIATWIGANPDDVSVTPNLDFVDEELSGRTLLEYTQAKSLGAPISNESIHRLMQRKGITEFEYEEELDKLNEEEPLLGGDGLGVEDDPPEDDPKEDPEVNDD